jgi:2-aminobenzoate-CoA ligase
MRLTPSAHVDTFCRDRLPPQDLWPELRFDLPDVAGYPRSKGGYPARLNCAAILLDDNGAAPGDPCLRSLTKTMTYAEVRHRTAQLARVLTEDFGLRPGNRVLLRGPNNPCLALSWLAVLQAGGVVVTTMALLRAEGNRHDRQPDRANPRHLRPALRRGPGPGRTRVDNVDP